MDGEHGPVVTEGELARAGVAYVLDDLYRSERFIQRELQQVERLGIPLRLCVLRRPWMRWTGRRPQSRPDIPARPVRGIASRLSSALCEVASSEPRGAVAALRWAAVAAWHARRMWSRPPALVHAHFAGAPAAVARLLAGALDRPWGLSVHAHDIYVDPARAALRMQGASHVVTCSVRAESDVRRLLGPAAPVHLVHHGLDLGQWPLSPEPPPADGVRLLAVGRLYPKKGFDVLVRACALLLPRLPGLRCTIVGEGPEQALLARLIRSLNAPVELLPWQAEPALKRLYRQATLLVAPCRIAADGDRDNIPNVVVEAMATGLPVVAGSIPSLVELGSGGACLLVGELSPAPLAEAIWQVATDPVRAATLRARGRRLVERLFDQSRNVRALVRLWGEAARPATAR